MKRLRFGGRAGGFPSLAAGAGVLGWFWFAASCALSPACGGAWPHLEAAEAAGAPMVVRVDAWAPTAREEAAVLADRMLRAQSDDLLLDEEAVRRATREAARALARLRSAHPEVADVPVREDHRPGTLLLGLAPDLFAAVSRRLLEAGGAPVALRTGNAAFDALNRRLGLWGARHFPATGVVAMYFSERVNVDAAVRAYESMEGVRYAESDARTGDGSDIAASRSGGTWRFVVRRGRGDCPSGCARQELLFFILRGGAVARVAPGRAMGTPGFAGIIARRGWR